MNVFTLQWSGSYRFFGSSIDLVLVLPKWNDFSTIFLGKEFLPIFTDFQQPKLVCDVALLFIGNAQ